MIFVLQKKHKVIFDSDRGRLATELIGDADLEVSSPVEGDESKGREALSVVTPSAKGESKPLDPLGSNLASEVTLSISSSDFEAQKEIVPLEVDPRVIHSVTGPVRICFVLTRRRGSELCASVQRAMLLVSSSSLG